jgi:DNA-binding protein HU-beta
MSESHRAYIGRGVRAMNKKDLAKTLAEERDISLAEASRQLDSVLGAITDALQAGENVRLPGFGTFEVVARPARLGRNPRTGATIEVQEARVPRFRAASSLKDAIASVAGGQTAGDLGEWAFLDGDPTTHPGEESACLDGDPTTDP